MFRRECIQTMNSEDSINTETSFHFQSPSYGDGVKQTLFDSFETEDFDGLRVMIASITTAGLDGFEEKFKTFCKAGKSLNFLVGTGLAPDPQAIRQLRDIRDKWPHLVNLQLVQTVNGQSLFHPKLYWFHGNKRHRLFVGSANWSGRGHTTNIEAMTKTDFTVKPSDPPPILKSLNESWTDVHESGQKEDGWGNLLKPTDKVLSELQSSWSGDQITQDAPIEIETSEESDRIEIWPFKNQGKEMAMDLTMEQGGDRISQVQPPLTVWRQFFDIDPEETQPEYEIQDSRTGDRYQFAVSGKDHNWTLEIPGARVSRPAIIVMRLVDSTTLIYSVYTPEDSEYDEIDGFLSENGKKPHPLQERRQYIHNQ